MPFLPGEVGEEVGEERSGFGGSGGSGVGGAWSVRAPDSFVCGPRLVTLNLIFILSNAFMRRWTE